MKNLISPKASVDQNSELEYPVKLYGNTKIHANCHIGKYTYMGNGTVVSSWVTIGRYCSIDRWVEIACYEHPTNFLSTHPFQYNKKHFTHVDEYSIGQRVKHSDVAQTIIGNDVWIGARSIIKRGITIGHGSIITAGSVVTENIPPYSIVSGTPANIIKYRFPFILIDELLKLEWWDMDPIQLSGVNFSNINKAIDQIKEIKLSDYY